MGTMPAGLPNVMSSLLAPVLISIDEMWAFARLNVLVAAPLSVAIAHGRLELIFRSSVKRRLWRKGALPCEIRKVPFERSRFTSGLLPEYSMWARYRSPAITLLAVTVMVAAPAST